MKKFEMYLDTSSQGMIITVTHRLNGTPLISMLRFNDQTNQTTYMSLYDSCIASIEALNDQEIKISFANAFKGFVRLYEADLTDYFTRLVDVEDDIYHLYKGLDHRATMSKFSQMSNYFDAQIKQLSDKITDLTNQLNLSNERINQLEN